MSFLYEDFEKAKVRVDAIAELFEKLEVSVGTPYYHVWTYNPRFSSLQ